VDAQNKFMGKSFEIQPTDVAHADLLLLEDMAVRYPKVAGEGRCWSTTAGVQLGYCWVYTG
jgi:hypothetical protein